MSDNKGLIAFWNNQLGHFHWTTVESEHIQKTIAALEAADKQGEPIAYSQDVYLDQIDADREAIQFIEAIAKEEYAGGLHDAYVEWHSSEQNSRTGMVWKNNRPIAFTIVARECNNRSVLTKVDLRPQPDRKAIEDEVIERCADAFDMWDIPSTIRAKIRALKGSK